MKIALFFLCYCVVVVFSRIPGAQFLDTKCRYSSSISDLTGGSLYTAWSDLSGCSDDGQGTPRQRDWSFNVSCETNARDSEWTLKYFTLSPRNCKGTIQNTIQGQGDACVNVDSSNKLNVRVDCAEGVTTSLEVNVLRAHGDLCPAALADDCLSRHTNTSCAANPECFWCATNNVCQFVPVTADCSYYHNPTGVSYYFPNSRACSWDVPTCNISQWLVCSAGFPTAAECNARENCHSCPLEFATDLCAPISAVPCRLSWFLDVTTAAQCPITSAYQFGSNAMHTTPAGVWFGTMLLAVVAIVNVFV